MIVTMSEYDALKCFMRMVKTATEHPSQCSRGEKCAKEIQLACDDAAWLDNNARLGASLFLDISTRRKREQDLSREVPPRSTVSLDMVVANDDDQRSVVDKDGYDMSVERFPYSFEKVLELLAPGSRVRLTLEVLEEKVTPCEE
jgi:hypothetical protein